MMRWYSFFVCVLSEGISFVSGQEKTVGQTPTIIDASMLSLSLQ